MAFADWFKRGRPSAPSSDLREELMALLRRQDAAGLMALINNNSEAIRAASPGWVKVPDAIRQRPDQAELYARMMFMLATVFERAGDASLMTRLKGDDLFGRWDASLNEAQRLTDGGRAGDAVTLVRSVLDEMTGMTGTGIDTYRPIALGRLGIALAKTGNREEAITVTRQALDLCRRAGDEDGIRAYTNNLKIIGSYELPGAHAGEKATVTLQDEAGVTLSPAELAQATGNVRWEVRGGEPIPPEAERLHQDGRAAGAGGDYQKALALFTSAAELAASWPAPVYDRAFTHLHLNDSAAALADYRRTLELSPRGFFTAALSADILTREFAGEFPTGLCVAFLSLETMTHEQRSDLLGQLVERFPTLSAAWSAYSDLQPDAHTRLAAIERGLSVPCDRDTYGELLVKKAMTLAALGEPFRAIAMLQPLVSDSSGSLNTQAIASVVLARLTQPGPAAATDTSPA